MMSLVRKEKKKHQCERSLGKEEEEISKLHVKMKMS